MNRRLKNIITLYPTIILLLIVLTCSSKAELSGEIENPDVIADTLDYGVCMPGDKLESKFYLKNTGDKTLKLRKTRPSYSIERIGIPGHDYDHEEFSNNLVNDSLLILSGDSAEITISYEPDNDFASHPYGKKIVRLLLGMYDSALVWTDLTSQYTVYKEYVLIVRKVKYPINGFETYYNFDSVYINPVYPIEYEWKVSNASNNNLEIDTHKTEPSSSQEFTFENKSLPVQMPRYSGPETWKIEYNPLDRDEDSMICSLGYKFNDTLRFASIEIHGVGVEQDLIIIDSDAQYFDRDNDTIDIGRVWVGHNKEIFVEFGNDGNMNFGAGKQVIYDGFEEEVPSEIFSIVDSIPMDRHFVKTHGDTFKINFNPDRRGKFEARYIIDSDIGSRSIRGVPADARKVVFFLKGEGVEPQLVPERYTVNFGTVVWHPDCQSSKTFTLKLSNTGNAELKIFPIEDKAPFKVEYFNNKILESIKPYAEDSINIIFSPNIQEDYFSELIIHTNENPPRDTVIVYMTASRIDPDNIRMSIPRDLKSKPGNPITIPILVNSKNINKARTFKTDLTFNRTLMGYMSYSKLGTASENSDIDIREINGEGKLSIFFETPAEQVYFLQRDTLIKLTFNTYIGDELSTSIAFIDPLLGDGVCDKVLLPLDTNGVFTIDSICGLSYKLLPPGSGRFFIGEFQPNPASDIVSINYTLKYDQLLEVRMFNHMGIQVKDITDGQQKAGLYELTFSCSEFSNGVYYLRFRAGLLSITKKLVISR